MIHLRQGAICVTVLSLLTLPIGCTTWTRTEQSAIEAYNEGNAFREQKRLEKAAQAYRIALTFQPRMAAASFNLALTLTDMGKEEEASEILLALKKRNQTNLRLIRALGWVARHEGDLITSLAYYLEALAVFEGDIVSLENLVEIYGQLRQYGNAIKYQKKLLVFDDSAENRIKLANLYSLNNLPQEALLEYQWVFASTDPEPDFLLEAGEIAEAIDLFDEAASYYRQAAQIDAPVSKYAWFRLSRLLLLHFINFELGIEAFKQAVDKGFQDDEEFYKLLQDIEPELIPAIQELIGTQEDADDSGQQIEETVSNEN